MGSSDFTSSSLTSGNVSVLNGKNIIFLILIFGSIYFLYSRKSKVKSGVAFLNISVSPHNEKIGILFAAIGLSMYGYHLYLESKHLQKDN